MGNVYLRTEVGSVYVINSFKSKVEHVLNRCLENGLTLDVADCRFGPDCALVLSVYYGKVNIIDSLSPERNKILENNAREAVKVFEPYPVYQFPKECNFDTLIEEFNKFKPGDKIALLPDILSNEQLAFTVMLILMLPEVEFDISERLYHIYSFVKDEWLLSSRHHDKYWEFTVDSIFEREVDSKGFMGTGKYGTGKLTEADYIRSQYCLPYDFGTKYCLEFDESGKAIGEWGIVVNKCITILTTPKKKRGPILADFVRLRKR